MDMRKPVRPSVLRIAALARALAAVSGGLGFVDALALAAPQHFETTLEHSVWEVQADRARCVLRHAIPDYGSAEFLRVPGRPLQVRVDLPKPPVEAHEVTLRAVPPGWNHDAQAREFGSRLVGPGGRGLLLEGGEAQALFDALTQGLYVEFVFAPVGAPAQAVVSLSSVRFLLSVPAFEDCVAALGAPAPVRAAGADRAQVAALAAPRSDVPAAAVAPPVPEVKPVAEEDPYIRTDIPLQDTALVKAETLPRPQPAARAEPEPAPGKAPVAGLQLVTELALRYGPDQDGLNDAARLELSAFVREYIARKRGDLVLIAGSTADGAQSRRRALEIKGYLVRNGVPATRVLIHVQGEKLPQRDGQPVEPPGDANRMAVWQVR